MLIVLSIGQYIRVSVCLVFLSLLKSLTSDGVYRRRRYYRYFWLKGLIAVTHWIQSAVSFHAVSRGKSLLCGYRWKLTS